MALRTDYTDDILDLDQNTNRKYEMTTNQDNSVSFTDVTAYEQEGSTFGAADFNATNEKVNELENSFSQALTDLKATAIAQAVGAVGNTFASVIATLATIVNRGAVSKTLGLGESYTVPQGYHNGNGKVSVSITSQEKTITASRSQQVVTPDSGKVLSKVTVNKYPDASGTYNATSRGSALDMGATNNLRYVNTNGVPNTNSGTYSVTSNGTKDMGATNTYRYLYVNIQSPMNVIYNQQGGPETLSYTASQKCFVVLAAGSILTNGNSGEIGQLENTCTATGNVSLVSKLSYGRNNTGYNHNCTKIWTGVINAGETVTVTSSIYGYGAGQTQIIAYAL